MAIGAIIGLISTVFQAVRAFTPPETAQPQQAADKLFSKLDELGQGAIGSAELQTAFEKIKTDSGAGADKLFARLDADGDGAITKSEFTGSINQLAEQLDQHYMRLRLQGEDSLPPPSADVGFTRDDLTGLVSNISGNFDRADADGDGRVSLKEARVFGQNIAGAGDLSPVFRENGNVELMLQVVRLMQAYGIVGSTTNTADNTAGRQVSDKV